MSNETVLLWFFILNEPCVDLGVLKDRNCAYLSSRPINSVGDVVFGGVATAVLGKGAGGEIGNVIAKVEARDRVVGKELEKGVSCSFCERMRMRARLPEYREQERSACREAGPGRRCTRAR